MHNTVEPLCEATSFAPEKWPSKRGGLSSGVELNTFMFRNLYCQLAFPEGLASHQGGLSKGVPLYLLSYTNLFWL